MSEDGSNVFDALRELLDNTKDMASGSTSSDTLRALGEEMESAQSQLENVFDELGSDYESDAAKQFELQLKHETDPEKTYDSWWIKNDRENIWYPTIGGKLPNDGAKLPWIITSYEESVQPGVRQAAELLTETRDASNTLATMSQDDLEMLSSVPTTLSQGIDVLAAASTSMESASNHIGKIENNLNKSSWEGDGQEAYRESLSPQADACKECQQAVEDTAAAAVALADLVVDVFVAFLGVRKKQLAAIQDLAGGIFTMVNPGNWLDVAEKMHSQMVKIQTRHVDEFANSLKELAGSAKNQQLLERAERTAGMVWPTPLSGIDGTWSGSAPPPPPPSPAGAMEGTL